MCDTCETWVWLDRVRCVSDMGKIVPGKENLRRGFWRHHYTSVTRIFCRLWYLLGKSVCWWASPSLHVNFLVNIAFASPWAVLFTHCGFGCLWVRDVEKGERKRGKGANSLSSKQGFAQGFKMRFWSWYKKTFVGRPHFESVALLLTYCRVIIKDGLA